MKKTRVSISKKPALLTAFLLAGICLPAAVHAETETYDLILPEADVRLYDLDELRLLPAQVLAYARNEIYARHGRRFRSGELTAWFDSQDWYSGQVSPSGFDDGSLNYLEYDNINTILYLENRIGTYKMDGEYGYDSQAVETYLQNRWDDNILSGLEIYQEDEFTSTIRTDKFIIEMPAGIDWEIEAYDNDTFGIFHVPSRDGFYDGEVVTIMAADPDDASFYEDPSWRICGYGEEKVFVAFFPTDVRSHSSSRANEEEYFYLLNWVEQMDAESEGSPFLTVYG